MPRLSSSQTHPRNPQQKLTPITSPWPFVALDKGKFKVPLLMTTPVEKRNHAKFCEFHGEVGHNTDECMHLRKQIEEMLKAGKLSHLIKEIKQNNGKEQKITQSFSPNTEISFPPLGEDEGTERPMIIEAEIGGHCIHRMYVDGGSAAEILSNTTIGNNWRRRALHFSLDEFCGRKVTIPVQWNYRKTRSQEVVCSPVNSSRNAKDPGGRGSNHLKKQQVGFVGMRAYKLRDLDGKQLPRTWNVSNLKRCYVHAM
ncbi:hypothetical protein Tco_0984993 [Tanacetum coccineum]